ncbi:hypothetical protein NXB04_20690 [Bacillus paranthracis]|uniref:hypothetical protein n=1 Tax=Bacillus paranthracis TaxID=2026186 RepID=UPI002150BB71|nr:hypothetical protein [Bacillus paranthracis]MCR6465124.1 hypothetical protein [Bacillus paranthracis]MCR9021574.1 hypothetical protein [Bacillus paranthracis]
MNSLVIFILVLIILNVLVFFWAKVTRLIWRIAGVIFVISSPFVFFITMNVIGKKVGDGFAGGAAGFTFGTLLVINAIILFIVAVFSSKKESKDI